MSLAVLHNVKLKTLALSLTVVSLGTLAYAEQKQKIETDINDNASVYGVSFSIQNAALAEQNWLLNCQGCHKAGAVGKGTEMPNMNGEISKFLSVPGGKEYISQVNGIANSPLSDEDLADLMNWMLVRYDPSHIPVNFSGFKAEDLSRLRQTPLDHTILEQRSVLMDAIEKAQPKDP